MLVKKADGSYRLAVDFRKLNKNLIKDTFPIPNINEAIDALAGAKFFSTLDLTSGFFQQYIDACDQHKTAITTHRGLFQWTRSPFGLATSPNAFQRLMNVVLGDLRDLSIQIYIDDIAVASQTIEEHFSKLDIVFNRLRLHNLKLKPNKCSFFKNEITFLGFKIHNGQISPINKNVEVIKNFKTPSTRKHLRSFLGCLNYYRKFFPDFSRRAKVLTDLTKGKDKFRWNEAAQIQFDMFRDELAAIPTLNLPNMAKDFVIYCDASGGALGAVLAQFDEDNFPAPVAFASRKLNDAESRYSASERELLGLVWSLHYFKCYVFGRRFTVFTDHAPLTHSLKVRDPTSRIARWLCSLADFNFEAKYIKGKCNSVADFLSRYVEVTSETNCATNVELCNVIANFTHSDRNCDENNLNNLPKCVEQDPNDNVTRNSECSWTPIPNLNNLSDIDDISVINEHAHFKSNFNSSFQNFNVNSDFPISSAIFVNSKFKSTVDSDFVYALNQASPTSAPDDHVATSLIQSEILPAQLSDPFCTKIRSLLKSNSEIHPQYMKFFVKDNVLMCNNIKKKTRRDSVPKIVLPLSLVTKVFSLAHDSPIACHQGFFKTYERVRHFYYWPGAYAQIKNLVASCDQCLAKRAHKPKKQAELQRLPIPNAPMETVHFDIQGPFPTSYAGNKYIVSFVCAFSKWPEAFPVAEVSSDTVANCLVEVICRHGCPSVLVTDKGPNLLSEAIENAYKILGMRHITTSAYRPAGNAKIERQHATVNAALSHLVDNNHLDWDTKLKFALLAIRSAVHSATNEIPAFILTGRDLRLPYNTLAVNQKISYNDTPSYCQNLMPALSKVFKDVKLHLEQAAESQEAYRSKVSVDKNINLGDRVMLYTPALKPGLCRKFAKLNSGPFRVTEKISKVNFKIQSLANPSLSQVVHVDRLSKCTDRKVFPAWVSQEEYNQDPCIQPVVPQAPFRNSNVLHSTRRRRRFFHPHVCSSIPSTSNTRMDAVSRVNIPTSSGVSGNAPAVSSPTPRRLSTSRNRTKKVNRVSFAHSYNLRSRRKT